MSVGETHPRKLPAFLILNYLRGTRHEDSVGLGNGRGFRVGTCMRAIGLVVSLVTAIETGDAGEVCGSIRR